MNDYRDRNGDDSKNIIIGLLSSFLFHLLLALLFMLVSRYISDKEPAHEKFMALKLDDFKREYEPSEPVEPSQPQPFVQKSKPAKAVQKAVQKQQAVVPKTAVQKPLPQPVVKPQSLEAKRSVESNASSVPKKSSIIDALNAQFKKQRQTASAPIRELYGDDFDRMDEKQRDYIKQNLSGIGRITEKYLRYPELAGRMGMQGVNVVEFYLHPNGDISQLKVIKGSTYGVLDRNSIDTIETAYKDYPRPETTTKIRIYVHYSIY